MEFKLDRKDKYALALEGGGARGAYEIGVWDALEEEGIDIVAVSGTSVGAINGAMVAQNELELSKKLWKELTYSQVMNVDDGMMRKLIRGKLTELDLGQTFSTLKDVLINGGFDVSPLMELFDRVMDEDKVRNSPREFYIVTVSLTDLKELEIRARDLKDGELHDMLLASAYLPVFKSRKLGGKRYVDGGFADNLPIHALTSNGYKEIIAVELNSVGVDRKFRMPDDVAVFTVKPTTDVGKLLDFNPEQAEINLKIGYYDAKRMMYGLAGSRYYIDRQMSEKEAYDCMSSVAFRYYRALKWKTPTYREINEKLLPKLASRLKASEGDYYDLFLKALETAAAEADIDRFRILTDRELLEECEGRFAVENGRMPKAFRSFFSSLFE